MPLCSYDVEPTQLPNELSIPLHLSLEFVQDCLAHLRTGFSRFVTSLTKRIVEQTGRIAAEQDVHAAARHIGRDGDGLWATGLGDNACLALVLLRVQDLVGNPFTLE